MPNLQLFGYGGLALSFSAAVAVPLLAGCGSSANGGNGGQGVGGHAVGGHGGYGIGGAGIGGGIDCGKVAADEVAPQVTVRFINHTAADVYIGSVSGSCSNEPTPYAIKDPQGESLVLAHEGACPNRCSAFTCTTTCGSKTTCPQPYVTRIAPQGTIERIWSGTVSEKKTLPGSCFAEGCGSAVSCFAWVKPPAVPLTFIGTVWTGMQCAMGACDCTPDASGTCVINYGTTGGDAVQATATLAPGATTVDVVFQ